MFRADGSLVEGESATEIFVDALEALGLNRVKGLDLQLSGEPLINDVPSTRYPSASKKRGAFYVPTRSSTTSKAKMLQKAADLLNEPLRIKLGA